MFQLVLSVLRVMLLIWSGVMPVGKLSKTACIVPLPQRVPSFTAPLGVAKVVPPMSVVTLTFKELPPPSPLVPVGTSSSKDCTTPVLAALMGILIEWMLEEKVTIGLP